MTTTASGKSKTHALKTLGTAAAFMFALGCAAFLLQPQAPANAQSDTTLVSNTSQTSATTGHDLDDDVQQAFTTGSSPDSYVLTSVEIDFHHIANTATAADNIAVWFIQPKEDPYSSATLLCILDPPESFTSSGVQTFTVPTGGRTCPTLDTETNYRIAVFRKPNASGEAVSLSYTNSTDEDTGNDAEWSIHDSRMSFPNGERTITEGSAFQIRINGIANYPPTASVQVAGEPLDANTSYSVLGLGTLELSAESIDPEGGDVTLAWVTDGGWFDPNYGAETTWHGLAAQPEPYDATIRLFAIDEHDAHTMVEFFVSVTPGPAPTPPSDLAATVAEDNFITLAWTNHHTADEIVDMEIQYRIGNQEWATLVTDVPKSDTSRDLAQGPPGEILRFRIQLTTSTGLAVYSNVAEAATRDGAPAPRHLSAHQETSHSVTLDGAQSRPPPSTRCSTARKARTTGHALTATSTTCPAPPGTAA